MNLQIFPIINLIHALQGPVLKFLESDHGKIVAFGEDIFYQNSNSYVIF